MCHMFLAVTLAAALAGLRTSAQQGPTVQTIDIGALEPGDQTFVAAINSRGVVAGTADAGIGELEHRFRAFTWTRTGGFRVIAHNAMAADINDHGVVIGRFVGPGSTQSFSWTASGGFRDLGDMDLPDAINNNGAILGYCESIRSWCVRQGDVTRRLPAGFSPTDLNDRGAVSGYYRRPDGTRRPAVWAPEIGVRDLDDPGSAPGEAYALNESGMVVGATFPVVDGRIRQGAAAWTPIGGSAWGSNFSVAINVSNRGWIVGSSNDRAAVWLLGRRLVELPDPDAFGNATAVDVNDSGYVVGLVGRQGIGRRSLLWIVR